MNILWYSLIALAAFVMLGLFVSVLSRWPVVGAVAVAVNVLIAWEVPYPAALVNVGGTSIYFLDILSAAFFALVLARASAFVSKFGFAAWLWIGIGALLAASLIRGLAENDFGTTLNEFRSYVYPYLAMTWAMTLTWSAQLGRDMVIRLGMWLGWGLTIVAGYHVARTGFGSTSTFVDAGTGLEQTTRPLVSGQALMLLLCALICLWFWRADKRRSMLVSGVIFLVVVVVSQQRTVWGVGLAVIVVAFIAGRGRTRGTILIFGVVVAWAGAVVVLSNMAPDLLKQLFDAALDSGTYDARIRSWTNLIQQSIDNGLGAVIFGSPMGGGFGRFEGPGRWVTFAPHNWYLTLYLRVGAVGLGLLLLFLAAVSSRLFRSQSRIISLAVLCAVVVYGWSYSWPWFVCLFLGWAISSGYAAVGGRADGSEINHGHRTQDRGRLVERNAP